MAIPEIQTFLRLDFLFEANIFAGIWTVRTRRTDQRCCVRRCGSNWDLAVTTLEQQNEHWQSVFQGIFLSSVRLFGEI